MQIVPIPPVRLIGHAKEHASFQFALVHECETRGADSPYVQGYRNIGLDPNYYLMMDNGAFELGTSMPLDRIVRWANYLNANEVVLPDRMFMADETIRMSSEAIPTLRKSLHNPKTVLNGVVHGRNHKEWLDCAYALADMGADVLSIPKDYEAWPGGREVLIAMLTRIGLPIHLIGMEKNYIDFTKWRDKELVRSMDTAKPYILAHHGISWWFNPHALVNRRSRPADFFDITFDSEQIGIATHNLTEWKKVA